MKKFILMFLLVLSTLTLTACTKDIIFTFEGVEDKTIEHGSEFKILDGVKVTGSDKKDYTDKLTYATLSAHDKTTHTLDTSAPGAKRIVYMVKFSIKDKEYYADAPRIITVNEPVKSDSMLQNGDFSLGTSFWKEYADGDGGIVPSVENGAFKGEITQSGIPYSPRISQMDVPFEQGKAYKISFKAKASIAGKELNLQVGEIIPDNPYFINFNPNKEVRALTTEWAEYSFEFLHTQDNKRGGLVIEFGMGTAKQQVTVWLDDIVITETELGPDIVAPELSGIQEKKNVKVGSNFNPIAGVTAKDNRDGDVTEKITFEIKKVEGTTKTVVTTVDTSVIGAKFEITYNVEDKAGNKATSVVSEITIIEMVIGDTELIKNGDFSDGETGWEMYNNYLGATVVFEGGVAKITSTTGGGSAWEIQFLYANMPLVVGKSYILTFYAKATAARDFNILFKTSGNTDIKRQDGNELTTEMQKFEFIYTHQLVTTDAIVLSFELGNTTKYAAGTVTFDDISLREIVDEPVLKYKGFEGWRVYKTDAINATLETREGHLRANITSLPTAMNNWDLQIVQDKLALDPSDDANDNVGHFQLVKGKKYQIKLDALASVTGNVPVLIGYVNKSNYAWTSFMAEDANNIIEISTSLKSYVIEFTVPEDVDVSLKLMFKVELGGLFNGKTGEHFFDLDNVVLSEVKEDDTLVDTKFIINGTMDQKVAWELSQSDGGAGTMKYDVDGNLVVNITNIGTAHYHVHLHNSETNTMVAGKYMIMITVKSDAARTLRANVTKPSDGYRSFLEGTKWDIDMTTEFVTYQVEFTVAADELGTLKIELDFGMIDDTSAAGTVTIKDFIIFPIY